jgi:hypothetical protein
MAARIEQPGQLWAPERQLMQRRNAEGPERNRLVSPVDERSIIED